MAAEPVAQTQTRQESKFKRNLRKSLRAAGRIIGYAACFAGGMALTVLWLPDLGGSYVAVAVLFAIPVFLTGGALAVVLVNLRNEGFGSH